jgi:hypothetical protein
VLRLLLNCQKERVSPPGTLAPRGNCDDIAAGGRSTPAISSVGYRPYKPDAGIGKIMAAKLIWASSENQSVLDPKIFTHAAPSRDSRNQMRPAIDGRADRRGHDRQTTTGDGRTERDPAEMLCSETGSVPWDDHCATTSHIAILQSRS